MKTGKFSRVLVPLALTGGALALVVTYTGSLLLALVAGLLVLKVSFVAIWLLTRPARDAEADPTRRRMLTWVGLGGLAWVFGGAAAGRALRKLAVTDPAPAMHEMARGIGAEYMELIRRTYHPERSGELQMVLAPFNSANYAEESQHLVPRDPRTSHASVWMYLERIPLVAYGPGQIAPSDSQDRVTLADLAPTTAKLMGFDDFPTDRDGEPLPITLSGASSPKVIVTFVIDGGGWNVLKHWPDAWPNLAKLMRGGANFRNAITGSFPAVTACAHASIGTGAFPNKHGITGHNIRIDDATVRKTYGIPGRAIPNDILMPTLADLWHDSTGAWVGQFGYQVWHMGMLGHGGRHRPIGDKAVGVFWDEFREISPDQAWQPHNANIFRLPASVPSLDQLMAHQAAWTSPGYDSQFDPPEGDRQAVCCSPPIIQYQGDLIEAAFDSEPIGEGGATSLVYINYKSPDYTGHIYNMLSKNEEIALREVDAQLGRLVTLLEERFAGEYVLFVTADHGQCPLPDAVGGTRVDPLQLGQDIDDEFRRGIWHVVQQVWPAEVFVDRKALLDTGISLAEIGAFFADYRYRDNIGPYVPRSAIEQGLLDQKEFAAVFGGDFLEWLQDKDLSMYGETAYPEAEPGIPPASTYGG